MIVDEDGRDPYADARDLVRAHYPDARWAVLAGSVITPARTPGSDLDVVVRVPDGTEGHRRSLRWNDWPVELFVNTAAGHEFFLAAELAARKPSLHRMIGRGAPVLGEEDAELTSLRRRCERVLAEGPGPIAAEDLEFLRYDVTDLLDDYVHAVDEGERVAIGALLWCEAAELMLAAHGRWKGRGKWLLRELRAFDPIVAARWLEARGGEALDGAVRGVEARGGATPGGEALIRFARAALADAGGPMFEGFHRDAPRPGEES